MKIAAAVLALALCPAPAALARTAAPAGRPLELAPAGGEAWRFPDLVHNPVNPNARRPCEGVRAKRPGELASPWRAAVRRIAFSCETLRDADGEPIAETRARAVTRPGAVTFSHIPVAEVITTESANASDRAYVLAVAFARAARRLRPLIEARMGEPMAPGAGTLTAEGGCENGLITLKPDETNRRRTVFSVSCEAD